MNTSDKDTTTITETNNKHITKNAIKPDTNLWAKIINNEDGTKETYPLIAHLLDTSAAIQVIYDNWLRKDLKNILKDTFRANKNEPQKTDTEIKQLLSYAAGLHDIGKINQIFQIQKFNSYSNKTQNKSFFQKTIKKKLEQTGYEFPIMRLPPGSPVELIARRHENVAYRAISGKYDEEVVVMDIDREWVAITALAHHGSLRDCTDIDLASKTFNSLCSGKWHEQQQVHIQSIATALNLNSSKIPPLQNRKLSHTFIILASALISLADWLASEELSVTHGKKLITENPESIQSHKKWLQKRKTWIKNRLPETLGTYQHSQKFTKNIIGKYEKSALQQDAEKTHDGLWIVPFPTGDGKTEAAMLRHITRGEQASQNSEPPEGIFFGLPTRSTADVMMNRFEEYFKGENNKANLLHAFAELHKYYQTSPNVNSEESEQLDSETSEINDSNSGKEPGIKPGTWHETKTKSLYNPIAIATCDQILVADLPQKWLFIRLLAIANHHIVLDEIHTYDAYQMELLKDILIWLGHTKTPVTLLSATLAKFQIEELAESYNPELYKTNFLTKNIETSNSSKTITSSKEVSEQGTVEENNNIDHYLISPPKNFVSKNAQVEITNLPTNTNNIDTKESAELVLIRQAASRYSYIQKFDHHVTTKPQESHIEWAYQKSCEYPLANIGIIVNRVDNAIEVGRRLVEKFEQLGQEAPDIYVLHSRMIAKHRMDITTDIVSRLAPGASKSGARGVIVVSTQVLEASVNIDLDFLSTDLAPFASLMQRAGRCWRFKEDSSRRYRVGDRFYDAHTVGDVVSSVEVRVVVHTVKDFGDNFDVGVVRDGGESLLAQYTQLPYLVSQQFKCWESIVDPEGTVGVSEIRVPQDVQGFMDYNFVSSRDLWAKAVGKDNCSLGQVGGLAQDADPYYDEFLHRVERLGKANSRKVSFGDLFEFSLFYDGFGAKKEESNDEGEKRGRYESLSKKTPKVVSFEELATRFESGKSVEYILFDSSFGGSGCLDVDDAGVLLCSFEDIVGLRRPAIFMGDRVLGEYIDKLRLILGAVVPVSSEKVNALLLKFYDKTLVQGGCKEQISGHKRWDPASKVLRSRLPVDISVLRDGGYDYSFRYGLKRI